MQRNATRCLLTLILLLACAVSQAQPAPAPVAAREQLNAVLWQQRAVEYRAHALQAYRQAASRLASVKNNGLTASVEQQRAGGFRSKPAAVVLDIDETVLDNSPFNALLLRDGMAFDAALWANWVAAARAAALPGAREFIAQARAARWRVVYITNRECNLLGAYDPQGRSLDCPQKKATLDNLQAALGYRPAGQDLLMRYELKSRDDSDKQARRLDVARTHRLAMLIGDDLNDFIRRADYASESHAGFWGATTGAPWYALPNAVYGSWERAFADVAQKYAGLDVWQAPTLPVVAQLRIVSWNLEWLSDPALLTASGFWAECAARNFPNLKLRDDLPFCDVYKRDGIVNAADYEAKKLVPMRARLAELEAQGTDILAVQETGDAAALQAVLPLGWRVVCFTTRVDPQNLGWAVREAANLKLQCQELRALSQEDNPAVPRPVRRGLELVATVAVPATATMPAGSRTLALLNVHLKSSCPLGRMDSATNSNCPTLQQQAPALEAWIEAQANAARPFSVIGDWNRDLGAEVAGGFPARGDGSDPSSPLTDPKVLRNLWPELNDLQPATSAMEAVEVDRSAALVAPRCHDVLDQVTLSITAKAQLSPSSLKAGRVQAALLARPPGASDHCPLRIDLAYR